MCWIGPCEPITAQCILSRGSVCLDESTCPALWHMNGPARVTKECQSLLIGLHNYANKRMRSFFAVLVKPMLTFLSWTTLRAGGSPRQSVAEAGRQAPEPAVGAAPTPPRMPWADGAEERPLPLSGRPQNLCRSSTPRTRLLGVRCLM